MESNQIYTSIVENSTQGEKTSSKPYRFFKINNEKFKKSVVEMCYTCIEFNDLTKDDAKVISDKISDNIEIENTVLEFRDKVISKNTYKTEDGQNLWYDYEGIAKEIKTPEDIYLLYKNVGEDQSDRVLVYVDGQSNIKDFIVNNNYEDIKDWTKTSNKQILLSNEIVKKQGELNIMLNNNHEDVEVKLGGK